MNIAETTAAMWACLAAAVERSRALSNLGFRADGSLRSVLHDTVPDDAFRIPGLPVLALMPDFLFRPDERLCDVVHESAHAAMAIFHGFECLEIGYGPNGNPGCLFEGSTDLDMRDEISAAGLLAEILVYGSATTWQASMHDFDEIAHSHRMAPPGTAGRADVCERRRILTMRHRKTSPEGMVSAMGFIPDSAFENVAFLLPVVLGIAEAVVRHRDTGLDTIRGEHIDAIFHAVMDELCEGDEDTDIEWPLVPDTAAVRLAVEGGLNASGGLLVSPSA